MKTIYWTKVESKKGTCIIMATDKGICWASTPGNSIEKGKLILKKTMKAEEFIEDANFPILKTAAKELKDYFSGKKIEFSGPFDLYGSDFQKNVWKEMISIPCGKTKTYGEIAKIIGAPQSARAVGAACRTNPVAIFVPCHRVVGSNGKLTGYAGGLPTKEWLLVLEQEEK